jgi:hypothetical protein
LPEGESCEHGDLVKCFKDKVVEFLTKGRNFLSDIEAKAIAAKLTSQAFDSSSDDVKQFILNVDGNSTILVTSPSGTQDGINGDGQLINQSPGANIKRTMEGMSIEYDPPASGDYTIIVDSKYSNLVNVNLGFLSSEDAIDFPVPLYVDSTPTELSVKLDPNTPEKLVLNSSIWPPYNLKTYSTNGNTTLCWNKMETGTGITSFKIYSEDETTPFFTLLDTVPGTTLNYQTSHSYTASLQNYALSSVDAQGKESFLSEVVSNMVTCPDCSNDDAIIQNHTLTQGSECNCSSRKVTLGPNVTLQNGSKLTIDADTIKFIPVVKVEKGAELNTSR